MPARPTPLAEPPGDVVLGALVGRVGEDPLGGVVLDEHARPVAVVADVDEESGKRSGILVEYDRTSKIFTTPSDQRTEDYVKGRFG